jgi:hypothetical protein
VLDFSRQPYRLHRLSLAAAAAVAAALLAGCSTVDQSHFAGLTTALENMHNRATDTHVRVRKLQETVYRAKVSLAPKLDGESLARPAWLDTSDQLKQREDSLAAVRDFVSDLRALASKGHADRLSDSSKKLFDGADVAVSAAKEVAATVAVLQPSQPIFGTLLAKIVPQAVLPQAALVSMGAAFAMPALERNKRGDLAVLMRRSQPVVKARLDSLAPSNEGLAEYVLALKTEYLPDAAQLREQLQLGDRYRFDQSMLDALAEFDTVAAQMSSLTHTAKLFMAAYEDAAVALEGKGVSGDALRKLMVDVKASSAKPAP